MAAVDDAAQPLQCPSAQPEMAGAVVLGVIDGTVEAPRLRYLVEPQRVTGELLALSAPVSPTEVFRFAAPCATSACVHFAEGACRLASRVVEMLPAVTPDLPICRLRPACRWWRQEGRAACRRCPQVVTMTYNPSNELRTAAAPGGAATADDGAAAAGASPVQPLGSR